MNHIWLVDVLKDIGDYAQNNKLTWLSTLVDEAHQVARAHLIVGESPSNLAYVRLASCLQEPAATGVQSDAAVIPFRRSK